MSVRHPTREDKILQKEEVEEKNHHQEREGVGMIDMNEDPLGEARIQKGRTSHQGATQKEDIKLMLVNGYPAPDPDIFGKLLFNGKETDQFTQVRATLRCNTLLLLCGGLASRG